MSKETTDKTTGLIKKESAELAPSGESARFLAEMEAAVVLANRYKRDIKAVEANILDAVSDPEFAAECLYSFPRGKSMVTGPAVPLAREMAVCHGNIRVTACEILYDDDDMRRIRAKAWDLQTGASQEAEDCFKKLIYRKVGGWRKPDERELRELTNRKAAILERNCILRLMRKSLVKKVTRRVEEVMAMDAGDNMKERIEQVVKAFSTVGVTTSDLETYLGHKLDRMNPKEVIQLRGVYTAIKDGYTTVAEAFKQPEPEIEPETAKVSEADLKKPEPDKPKRGRPKKSFKNKVEEYIKDKDWTLEALAESVGVNPDFVVDEAIEGDLMETIKTVVDVGEGK